jgi:LPS export ABC transporter protein LptC
MPDLRRLPVLFALVLALGGGCSLNYEEVRAGVTAEVPDTIMNGFSHTVVSDGRIWVKMSAERAESYGQGKRIELAGVRLEEYDRQGRLVTRATADRVVYHNDSEDAELQGNIFLEAPEEKASLAAEDLSWVKDGKRLSSDSSVRLARQNGSYLEGRGFQADFRRRRLEFRQGASGSYVEEDDAGR